MRIKQQIEDMAKKYLRKGILFVWSGLLAYPFSLALTYVLTEHFRTYYLITYAIIFFFNMLLGFFLSANYVFRVRKIQRRQVRLYFVFALLFYILNILLVKLLVDVIGVYYLAAMAMVTGSLLVCKFFLFDKHVFNEK